jgi:alkylation response protein AidB-like acyl-CoA dehydrogenase
VDLTYTDAQQAIRTQARELLGAPDAPAVLELSATPPGYDERLWRELLDRGWPRLSFPTEVGGSGGSLSDLAVFAEELGRSAVPTPFHNGIVQAGLLLAALGGDACEAHLRSLLSGERRYALCLTEDEGSWRLDRIATRARTATPDEGWVVEGAKCYVPHLDSAEVLLVVAAIDGGDPGDLGLFAVDATDDGVARSTFDTIGQERSGRVELRASVGPDRFLAHLSASDPAVAEALDRAAIVLSADVVGAAAGALDHAVARVTEREIFGQPVGSYQAVQHRGADMLMDLTMARDAVMDAAAIADRGEPLAYATSVAKAFAAEACRRITAGSHQISGGEGVFGDQPLHLWFRRVKAAEPVLGDPRSHRARIADIVFGGPGTGPGFDRYPTRI